MLKRQIAYIVIIGLLFTGIANAGGFNAYGINDLSCGNYIQIITTNSEAENAYSWWIAGFVTGTNFSKRRNTSTDNAAHNAWLKKYCNDNPLDNFMHAAMKLNETLDSHTITD